jgi:hypothetical protein
VLFSRAFLFSFKVLIALFFNFGDFGFDLSHLQGFGLAVSKDSHSNRAVVFKSGIANSSYITNIFSDHRNSEDATTLVYKAEYM